MENILYLYLLNNIQWVHDYLAFYFCNVIGKNDVFCFCPKIISNMEVLIFWFVYCVIQQCFIAHGGGLNNGEGVVLMLREEKVGRKQWAAGSFVTE